MYLLLSLFLSPSSSPPPPSPVQMLWSDKTAYYLPSNILFVYLFPLSLTICGIPT